MSVRVWTLCAMAVLWVSITGYIVVDALGRFQP